MSVAVGLILWYLRSTYLQEKKRISQPNIGKHGRKNCLVIGRIRTTDNPNAAAVLITGLASLMLMTKTAMSSNSIY